MPARRGGQGRHAAGRRRRLALPGAVAVAAAVDSVGTGLYFSGGALFFTRGVGLAAGEVGFGLSLGAGVGLLSTYPLGRLADRVGARKALVAVALVRAAGFSGYAVVHNFAGFLIVATSLGAVNQVMAPLMQSIATQAGPAEQRSRKLAEMRVLRNAGFGIGSLAAIVPLQLGGRAAFNAIVLGDALSFVMVAGLVGACRLPAALRSQSAPRSGGGSALPDVAYIAVTVCNSVLMLQVPMLTVLLPLWATEKTSYPAALVPALLVVNTVVVVVLQLRVSRLARSTTSASRLMQWAAPSLAACCLLAWAAAGRGTGLAVMLIVGAVLALTAGELLSSAGAFHLSSGLAPAERRSSYLAFFGLSTSAAAAAGPWLLTVVVLNHARIGWPVLMICFACAGLGVRLVAARLLHQTTAAREGTCDPILAHAVLANVPGRARGAEPPGTPESHKDSSGRRARIQGTGTG